ncbi:hypothetical protein FKW77_008349 [Venturia effusa]|uniref:Uncharacterized protein n=1 Tax=Venturia effusa TaxID=50376 RepID=A0A517LG39_9PEZI|nr:hypothetical protein FKW77_008349 [Venturia effusa]
MDPITARLSYLDHAAHLLSLSSPSTAAAFQARYDRVAKEKGIEPPATRAHEICSACGYNMLSTAQYTVIPRDKSRNKGNKRLGRDQTEGAPSAKDKTIVLECSACLSRTTVELPAPKRRKPSSGRTQDTDPAAVQAAPTSGRAASWQTQNGRAKAKRAKKRNSLHAMLAKSKEEAQPGAGFGLGLLDLMKSA